MANQDNSTHEDYEEERFPYEGFEYLNITRTFTYTVKVEELWQYNNDKKANDLLSGDDTDPLYFQIDPFEDAETNFVTQYVALFGTNVSTQAIDNQGEYGNRQTYFFGTSDVFEKGQYVGDDLIVVGGDVDEWPWQEGNALTHYLGYVIVMVTREEAE